MDTVGTIFENEEIGMKWLWRYVWNRMKEIGNEPQESDSIKPSRLTTAGPDTDWTNNLNIMVTSAVGGKIITFRRYDHKNDRSDNKIYVIPEDHNFNEELGKLITLESLR